MTDPGGARLREQRAESEDTMDDVTAEETAEETAAKLLCPILTQALATRNSASGGEKATSVTFQVKCLADKCIAFNRLPDEGFECLMMRKGE